MARTTRDAVLAILAPGKDYDKLRTPSLDIFIATANNLVTFVVQSCARFGKPQLDDTAVTGQATIVEGWLAAGLYKESDQQYQQAGTKANSASFRGQSGARSESNKYISAACMADYSGVLRAVLDNKIASTGWLGKPPSQQIPYSQRS